MTLPTTDTIVLYPSGATTAEARVLHVESVELESRNGDDSGTGTGGTGGTGLRLAVLLDRTAVHPVDAAWPDQRADRAVLDAGDEAIPVLDAVVGAWQNSAGGPLLLGRDIPVRKGTEGWTFVVAHLVDADASLTEGDTVTVEVDAADRAAISAGHTGCHLASLALNAALADAWSKEAPLDAAGSPNFDALAIETSTILENGSLDVYRIGKSLRRKGFDPAAIDDLGAIAAAANASLAAWVSGGGGIRIERDGEGLTDRRFWVAELPQGEVRIPCGGTHAESLADLASVRVALVAEQLDGAVGLTMTTVVE